MSNTRTLTELKIASEFSQIFLFGVIHKVRTIGGGEGGSAKSMLVRTAMKEVQL